MKKYVFFLLPLLLVAQPKTSRANTEKSTAQTVEMTQENVKKTQIEALELRIAAIQAIDKSGLTKQEKAVLRKEARSIKKELNQHNGNVVISATSIIIILLILIILL